MKVYEKFNEFEINGVKPFIDTPKLNIHDMLVVNMRCDICPKLEECKRRLSKTAIKPKNLCHLLLWEWLIEEIPEEEKSNGNK